MTQTYDANAAHQNAWARLVDENGNPLSIGGGTEYSEDAAAAANPTGHAMILVRRDTLATNEVSADGDNVAAKATSKGQLHVRDLEADALFGASNESAPASDTAASGLNGRLQRIAQRVTSLIGLLPAALGLGGGLKVDPAPGDYETIAASQTDQMMGPTGAAGDRLDAVLIIPATTSPGAVSIEDGSTNTVIFAGGASSVTSLIPFLVPMGTQGIVSASGGWEITTGANVSAIAYGQFS